MKAMYENDKIINIVTDGYDPGNPEITIAPIASLGFDLEEGESIMGSCITENGAYKYYLVDGVLNKYTQEEIEASPEYIARMHMKRGETYKNLSDPLFFKYQAGEIEKQVWIDARDAIKNS